MGTAAAKPQPTEKGGGREEAKDEGKNQRLEKGENEEGGRGIGKIIGKNYRHIIVGMVYFS